MKRPIKFIAAVAVAAVGMLAGHAAYGATPPFEPAADTGWDGAPDSIIGQGSDTTFLVMQAVGNLYNGAPGCQPYNGIECTNPQNPLDTRVGSTNYDHDAANQGFPTGSGAGITGLLTPANYAQGEDYARSSRPANAGETAARTFWGYAVDGLAELTFGTRSGVALSQAQVTAIYHCTTTNWSAIPGSGAAGTIVPWGMNSASGTAAVFAGYAGFTADTAGVTALNNQPCVRKLVGPDGIAGTGDDIAPFENDVKPILDDPANAANAANFVWWMSFGDYLAFPFKASNPNTATTTRPVANLVNADGTGVPSQGGIFNQTYANGLLRLLWHVTKNGDADCVAPAAGAGPCNNTGNAVAGAAGGKGGAVRQLTQFLCNTSNAQYGTADDATNPGSDINPATGTGYRSELNNTLGAFGFQTVKAGANPKFSRTTGYQCFVDTQT